MKVELDITDAMVTAYCDKHNLGAFSDDPPEMVGAKTKLEKQQDYLVTKLILHASQPLVDNFVEVEKQTAVDSKASQIEALRPTVRIDGVEVAEQGGFINWVKGLFPEGLFS